MTNSSINSILRLPEVIKVTGLGKSTIYLKAKDKNDPFPAPVKLSARASGWRASELSDWIESLTGGA